MTFAFNCPPDQEGTSTPKRGFPRKNTALSCALTLILSACGTTHTAPSSSVTATGHTAAPSGAATPASSASGPAAGTPGLPAFDAITKGAEREDGYIPIWKRQDKVLFEIAPELLGKPLFLSPKLATGLGEAGLFGGLMQSRWAQMGRPQWVEFRKVQQQIQLVAINAAFTAKPGTPEARAVDAAFSPSLLSSVPILSAGHGKSGAVLIDAQALFITDLLGLAPQLQRTYRQAYAFDAKNSNVMEARPEKDGLFLEVQHHFGTATLAQATGAPGPAPSYPVSVPDPRSLFITVHYSLTPLPAQTMTPRVADQRVGYFTTTVADFSNDLARNPRKRFINRWPLEKKDPAADKSPPVKPIVFWLDPSIPIAYRGAVKEGVLEWNKAFEAIGFEQAIEVKDAPTDTPFDTLATGHAAIRWMTNSQPRFGAIGPTHVDPRTGEILDANIALESLSTRGIRAIRSQFMSQDATEAVSADQCEHGAIAGDQLGYALDLKSVQAGLPPDSPEVQAFVLAYLKDTTMHEVGHTLGLRHNFRASRWRPNAELNDKALTDKQGNSASVMDYAPINLPLPGQPSGAPFQTTLGPYDYWAIEYGYKPLPANVDTTVALRQIAQRSDEPAHTWDLAYGSDEDAALGLDPEALTFDLGRDPVAFAKVRLAIVQDQLLRLAHRQLKADEETADLRRSVAYALRDLGKTAVILERQVGGVITRRDGPQSTRDLIEPLPSAVQRQALDLLIQSYLSTDAIRIPPALQRRLAPDYLERADATQEDGMGGAATDFSMADQLLARQREVLAYLMNEGLSDRLGDNQDKVRDREPKALSANELQQRIQQAVWSDTHASAEQAPWQRNLQREYINRLTISLLRGASARADTRAAIREQAKSTLAQLKGARKAPKGDASDAAAWQAHRQDCIETLERALQASVIRVAP
ncbi:MAG: zinc-dependent metalloprotease [Burkholderiales bacterium]|nr:zinc-dependent metalloprotease [Burkholderiales bacterium]